MNCSSFCIYCQCVCGKGEKAAVRRRKLSEACKAGGKEYVRLNIKSIYGGMLPQRANAQDHTLIMLASSIAKYGLLQPIVVRKSVFAGRYMLVCGTRRLVACRMAGMHFVDALLIDADEQEAAACFLEEHWTRELPSFLDEAELIAEKGGMELKHASVLSDAFFQKRLDTLALDQQTADIARRAGLTVEQVLPILGIESERQRQEAVLIVASRALNAKQAMRLTGHMRMLKERIGKKPGLTVAMEMLNNTVAKIKDSGIDAQLSMHSREEGICIRIMMKSKKDAQ